MSKFNVAAIHCCTTCEGPCHRVAIWFQGCNLRCAGCCNPDFQPFVVKKLFSLKELCDVIDHAKEKYQVEGVTFLGGEPTLQQNLPQLAEEIQKLNLGVILFTGKLYGELKEDLLRHCDLVVDGTFQKENLDTSRNLVGSQNQKIYYVTPRYCSYENWFLEKRRKKVHIQAEETLLFSGDVLF